MNDWLVIVTTSINTPHEPMSDYELVTLPIVNLVPNYDGDQAAAAKRILDAYPALDLDRCKIWVVPWKEIVQVEATRETVTRLATR
jgi:hypothetical protein